MSLGWLPKLPEVLAKAFAQRRSGSFMSEWYGGLLPLSVRICRVTWNVAGPLGSAGRRAILLRGIIQDVAEFWSLIYRLVVRNAFQ